MADKSIIPLNFELLLNPLNWFTVILMLLIAGFALHLLLGKFGNGGNGPKTPIPFTTQPDPLMNSPSNNP